MYLTLLSVNLLLQLSTPRLPAGLAIALPFLGSGGGLRTHDLSVNSRLLHLLSYPGICGVPGRIRTDVSELRARDPRPLDDRDICRAGDGARTRSTGLKGRYPDQLDYAREGCEPAWVLAWPPLQRSPTQERLAFSFETRVPAWVDIEPQGHDLSTVADPKVAVKSLSTDCAALEEHTAAHDPLHSVTGLVLRSEGCPSEVS